jgi:tRNA-splicing ligase RtcB
MVQKSDLKKINDYLWEAPKTLRPDMRVAARIYASEKLLDDIFRDRSVAQLLDGATLPGIAGYAIAMPDCHEGYSVPIGFVGAVRMEGGVISPGACGFDINCGMKLLKSNCTVKEVVPYLEKLASQIQKEIPSGLGRGREIKLSFDEIDKILDGGTRYIVEKGMGQKEDIDNCEAGGRLDWADPAAVSKHAKERGQDQVGTLGSGNHFLEIQKVERIFDQKTAAAFSLFENQVVIMIHTGSRALGHQVCTDYLKIMIPAMYKYGINMPDREFACVPFGSAEGQRYFSAMAAAANYAWASRQTIAHYVRRAWSDVLGKKSGLAVLYDLAHNVVKKETHIVDGAKVDLLVHRKGATRAFPPGHEEIPEIYRPHGQPVFVPGSMGTASYVLAGSSENRAFSSACHGSGRAMSRHEALRRFSGRQIIKNLEEQGVVVRSWSARGMAEEAPYAYKNIDEVIEIVHNAGLARKVARLVPLAVVKGE